ncbi:MAG: aldehyde dehydrogenase [Myxococcales bacterium]|nr:aldehyde dehydrogenase [Myxococcales bacterium]
MTPLLDGKLPQRLSNWVDGRWQAPLSGIYLPDVDPATGVELTTYAASTQADVEVAVAAAQRALGSWSARTGEDRARILHRIADEIAAHAEKLALWECLDTGKPLAVARSVDIARAEANFRFFANAASQFASESHAMADAINYTLRQAVGVAACISPWNLPLYLLTWKVAPALATGCTVVAKPSEVTPLTASLLAELTERAGLPAGVLNLVHGEGVQAGAALVQHSNVAAVSFTGSTRVGEDIQHKTAGQFKKLSLELGGKNAFVVFADADVDKALVQALRAGFSNQGQICLCGSRILVHRSLFDSFVAGLVAGVRRLRVGDPLEATTDQGALVSAVHRDKVLACIATARAEGGEVVCGGGPAEVPGRCSNGFFVQPTVIIGLGPDCGTNREEIFGPVVTVQAFDDDEQALTLINASRYGLACSLWTQNLRRAHRVAAQVQAGIVWINCWMVRDLRTPFGGSKASGLGREGGWEAMRFFTEPKNICVAFD